MSVTIPIKFIQKLFPYKDLNTPERCEKYVYFVLAEKSSVSPNLTPVQKGKSGEKTAIDILYKHHKDIEIIDTSKKSNFGDFIVDKQIMYEIKNYKSTVPTSQIEKFKKDLICTSMKYGVFISLAGPIAGFKRFEINITTNNIQLYVPWADEIAIKWSYIIIKSIIEFMNKSSNSLDGNKIEKIKEIISKFIDQYRKMNKHLNTIEKQLISVRKIGESNAFAILDILNYLK